MSYSNVIHRLIAEFPMNQRRYLPTYAVLRSFEAAARHQSFTLAAEELSLSQGAISRQVKELEQTIGTALFRRVGRGVRLTEAGFNFAQSLAQDLENIRQTVSRAIAAGSGHSVLRVSVLPTFGNRWLVPRLEDFTRRNPEVSLSLATRVRPFDLARERFDLAIHFGQEDWPDARMTHLCHETLLAIAAPEFAKRHSITSAAALSEAPLLHLETRPRAWADWFHAAGITDRDVYPGMQFDQFSMIITAARHGLGAGLVPSYLIEEELSGGALVQLDPAVTRTRNSYFIATPEGIDNPAAAAFAHWLSEQVSRAF
ncbi:MAG: LysR family transcriptional regulator [Paracoccaceae bacterium]